MPETTSVADQIVNFRFGVFDQGFEYRPVNAQGGDETCGLVQNSDKTWSILSPNGAQWLSIQPDGSREARNASQSAGAWEKFTRDGNVLTELTKDGVTRPLIQFLLRQSNIAPIPNSPIMGEHGPLHIESYDERKAKVARGEMIDFYDENNQPWLFAGDTIHTLACSIKKGDDITPVLNESQSYGANVIVMICTHLSDWKIEHGYKLDPREAGWQKVLEDSFNLIESRKMRCAPACFADAQDKYGLTNSDRQRAWVMFKEVCKDKPFILPRLVNEGPHNGIWPGDFDMEGFGNCLVSRGSMGGNTPPWPSREGHKEHATEADYKHWAEWEGRRGPWHKAFDDAGAGILELQAGYTNSQTGDVVGPFPVPLVGIEHAAFAATSPDVNNDERWTSKKNAATLGVVVSATCAGGAMLTTSHMEARLNSELEAECSRAYFKALKAGFQR